MWIDRDFISNWKASGGQPVKIVLGPRQTGKTSFLRSVAEPERKFVDFDDLPTRDLAARDPRAFLDSLPNTLVIDEAQYVPSLFPEIKRRVDLHKRARLSHDGEKNTAPSYWLTGSNRLALDKGVAETLTGRASYFFLSTLTYSEILASRGEIGIASYFLRGGWPELWANPSIAPIPYLNDHIQSTLEKDLVRTAGITKVNEFLRVLRLLSGRVGGAFCRE